MQTTNMKSYMKPVMRSKVMPTRAGGAPGSMGADLGGGDPQSITVRNAMRRMPQGAGGAPGGGIPRPDIKSAIGSLNQQLGLPGGSNPGEGPSAGASGSTGSMASAGGPLPKRYAGMDPATAAQRYSMFKQGQLPGQQGGLGGGISAPISSGGGAGMEQLKSFPAPQMDTLDVMAPESGGISTPINLNIPGGGGSQMTPIGGGPPSAPFFPGQPSGPDLGGLNRMPPGGGPPAGNPRPFVGAYNPYLQLLRQQMGGGQGAAALGAMA